MLDASPSVQTPDEILVRRAGERDPSAREELFQRYRDEGYRVAYRLLGNEQDAMDVVQEALIKAFLGLGDFDGRSGFRYWFLRIVSNTALDWGRHRKRRTIQSLDNLQHELSEPALENDPARGLYILELRQTLQKALADLSPKIRTTFVLYAESGLSYKEIAEMQKIPIGTVMSRINAAREKLQANLNWDKLKSVD